MSDPRQAPWPWNSVYHLLSRGHRAVDVARVYAHAGVTTDAIYHRNSRYWHLPLKKGSKVLRCSSCRQPRAPQLAPSPRHWQSRYAITADERETLMQRQDGLCAAGCGRAATDLDHDHESGRVRGILCGNCNKAEGLLKTAEQMRRLADYVEYWAASELSRPDATP